MSTLRTGSAVRRCISLLGIFAVTSLIVHVVLLSNRNASKKIVKDRRSEHKIEELSGNDVVIPSEYLQNIPNISRHNFNYLHNPYQGKLCYSEFTRTDRKAENGISDMQRKKLLILFMVHSKAEHFEHRKTIRETWGSVGKRLTEIVFLLGKPSNLTVQGLVHQESQLYNDIVQEDFDETYRNITLKNIMGLKWASQNCGHAKYVVKADDDVFINTKMLISTLINSELPSKRLILCKIHFFKNVPREGKYTIDRSMYSGDRWPSFCFGGCWIASSDVVRNLYGMSLQTKQIYLDDVYVTGILRTKLSLPINYLSGAYRIFCHTRGNPQLVREMWDSLLATMKAKESGSLQNQNQPYIQFWSLCFT